MSRRSNNWNAYETSTTGPLAIGAVSVAVDSAAGLVAPLYLVIDPDNPLKREWIRVNTINANSLENLVRNLPGSVGDVAHDAGAKIRSVPTKQIFDDLFQDVEDSELNLTQHETDGGDPHAQAGYLKEADTDGLYVRLVGSQMTGFLTLFANPTSALHAATKQYVDVVDDKVDVNVGDITTVTDDLATHTSDVVIHHTKYTNGEAVAAVEAVPVLAQGNFTDANGEFSFGGVAANMHLRFERPGANFQWRFAITSPGGVLTLQSSPDGVAWTTVDTWSGI